MSIRVLMSILADLRALSPKVDAGFTMEGAMNQLQLSGLRQANLKIALTDGIPLGASPRDLEGYDALPLMSRRIRLTWLRRTIKNKNSALRTAQERARYANV